MKRNSLYRDGESAADVIKILCPEIAAELSFIESHLKDTEQIDLHCWFGSLFYIVIRDNRLDGKSSYADVMRAGLTVDIKTDSIFWNDLHREPNLFGGNCFVRAAKWKNLYRKRFHLGIKRIWREKFNIYSDKQFHQMLKSP